VTSAWNLSPFKYVKEKYRILPPKKSFVFPESGFFFNKICEVGILAIIQKRDLAKFGYRSWRKVDFLGTLLYSDSILEAMV
jgi:hypothetical protein